MCPRLPLAEILMYYLIQPTTVTTVFKQLKCVGIHVCLNRETVWGEQNCMEFCSKAKMIIIGWTSWQNYMNFFFYCGLF